MANHIEWWLVEVERRLSKHLSEQQVVEITEEAREHLCEIRDGLGEAVNAELEAVRQFGSPEVFAEGVLDSLGGKNFKKAFWQVLSIAAVGTLMPAIILEAYETLAWQPYWSLLIFALLVGLFCRVCARNRKLHLMPILTGTLTGYLILGSYLSVTHVKLPPFGAVRVSEAKETLTASRMNLDKLAVIQRHLSTWQKARIEIPQKDGMFEAPYFYVGFSQGSSMLETPELVTLRTKSKEEAHRVYAKSQEDFRRQHGTITGNAENNIALLSAVLSRSPVDNARRMFEWATPVMVPALILMPFLNLLILIGQELPVRYGNETYWLRKLLCRRGGWANGC